MPHPIISVPKGPAIAFVDNKTAISSADSRSRRFGERGGRRRRTRRQTRTHMGADANAHCPAFADKYRFKISESTSIWAWYPHSHWKTSY